LHQSCNAHTVSGFDADFSFGRLVLHTWQFTLTGSFRAEADYLFPVFLSFRLKLVAVNSRNLRRESPTLVLCVPNTVASLENLGAYD
jgi:hypothetical protein